MDKIDSTARYSKNLSNDSFDAASVQILLNSDSSNCNNKRRKVIIGSGALIGLLSGVLLITLLLSNSTSNGSLALQNNVLSKSKTTMLPSTLTPRNPFIRKKGNY